MCVAGERAAPEGLKGQGTFLGITLLCPQGWMASWGPRFLSGKMGVDTLLTLVLRGLRCCV